MASKAIYKKQWTEACIKKGSIHPKICLMAKGEIIVIFFVDGLVFFLS